MTIADVIHVEDCLDGSFIREITFDGPVTREFIESLKHLGNTCYYPDFPRPFYTLEVQGAFSLRGVEGSNSTRMIIYRNEQEAIARLSSFLATSPKG